MLRSLVLHMLPPLPRPWVHVLRYNPGCPQTTQPSARDYHCKELKGLGGTRMLTPGQLSRSSHVLPAAPALTAPSPARSCLFLVQQVKKKEKKKVTLRERGGWFRGGRITEGFKETLFSASPESQGRVERGGDRCRAAVPVGGPGPLATPPAAPDKQQLHRATVRYGTVQQGEHQRERRPGRPTGHGKSLLGNPAFALQVSSKGRGGAGRFQRQLRPLR